MVLPDFPQDTGWTNRGQYLLLRTSPNFNQKATGAFEAGNEILPPQAPVSDLAVALGSLWLNPPL